MRLPALLAALALTAPASAQSVDRIDPPNWWVGMEQETVELLIRGTDLNGASVSTDQDGVNSDQVSGFPDRDYLAVTLSITDEAQVGDVILTLEFEDSTLEIPYPLLERAPWSPYRSGFGSNDVVYLVQPDRFANGDPTNDTVDGYVDDLNRDDPGGRHGGDLAGLIDHLPYIADMGFTQLWLNPVQENAEERNSYHGYAITDSYAVDPRFGTLDEYVALSRAAREASIGMIMDVVPNHFGSNHYLNRKRPGRDWFNGSYRSTNHRQSTIHDPYAAQVDRDAFEDGWFAPTMPDLDQTNPHVARYLIQNTIWWIETVGLTGLRIDTYAFSDPDFMVDYTRAIRAEYPNLSMVGEVWSLDPILTAGFQHEGPVNPVPDAGTGSLMDFPLLYTLIDALTEDDSWDTGLARLYNFLGSDRLYADPQALMTFADNHDFDRIHTQLGEDVALTKMALSLIMTMRGTPQVLYGTEILATNQNPGDHGQIRSDFPGGFEGDSVNVFTREGLSAEQADMFDFTRTLTRWRSGSMAAAFGDTVHYVPDEDHGHSVYVFGRTFRDEGVLVLVNKTDAPVSLNRRAYLEIVGTQENATNVVTGEPVDMEAALVAAPRAVTILEFDR